MTTITTEGTIRLSVREIRELPYRALRVAGLADGEATAAAECVSFAELHAGDGLRQVLTRCAGGRRDASPLAFERQDGATVTTYRVHADAPLDPLADGLRLIELAAGAGRPTRVVAPTMPDSSLLDLPLVLAAERTGRTTVVVALRDGAARVRTASPDGSLATADVVEAAAIGSLVDGMGPLPEAATIVWSGPAEPFAGPPEGASTATARAATRAHAAEHGIEVPTAVWREVLACAAPYKQPERKETA